ncbi:MAG: beta-N-acetylhexosaminidase [Bacteroidales bacterium]
MRTNYFKKPLIVAMLFCISLFPSCKKNGENPQAQTLHPHGIIPLPLNVDLVDGNLSIDKNIVLVTNPQFQSAVLVVENALNLALGQAVIKSNKPSGKTNIQFLIDNSLDTNAYQITINNSGIVLKANGEVGAFYAAQSLRQIIWNSATGQKKESFDLHFMAIQDKPKYSWRGFHLDVSRHFFAKEYILELIDWLAYYKFNKLQLHLTDDQGWRIELDQFPLLTEIGAWRTFNSMDSTCMQLAKTDLNYTIDKRFIKEVNGKTLYGGFYTKQDIRDIMAYASAHYIDVIPEIDMPGHMSAAIRAYPQLSCVDSAGWGTEFSFPICPCNPDVMDFSYKVWDEIVELFPSNVVHVGCDEVEKGTWASSPECQLFMQANGIASLNGIQDYFLKKIQEHLQAKGKTIIAWDDVIDGNPDNKITMMYWRAWVADSPERCAANGNPIILTPWSHFYISSPSNDENLQNLYAYNPLDLFPANVINKVQGMQGCVWTEEIPSEAIFERHVFPALQALAEVCWTRGRDYSSFQKRMKPHFSYMDAQKLHYRKPAWGK